MGQVRRQSRETIETFPQAWRGDRGVPAGHGAERAGGKPRHVSETIETLADTIETMPGDDWEADGSEDSAADHRNRSGRTRARASIGSAGLDDPVIGELLAFDHGDLADLFQPDFPEPSRYRPQYARIAYKFFLLGATVEQLADVLCVGKTTIYNWEKDHPDFRMALRGGREHADANVASRLYARAMGYSHEEEEIKVVEGQVVRVPTVKHYPPGTGRRDLLAEEPPARAVEGASRGQGAADYRPGRQAGHG